MLELVLVENVKRFLSNKSLNMKYLNFFLPIFVILLFCLVWILFSLWSLSPLCSRRQRWMNRLHNGKGKRFCPRSCFRWWGVWTCSQSFDLQHLSARTALRLPSGITIDIAFTGNYQYHYIYHFVRGGQTWHDIRALARVGVLHSALLWLLREQRWERAGSGPWT